MLWHENFAVPVKNNRFNYTETVDGAVPYLKGEAETEEETHCIIINKGDYENGKRNRG